MTVKYQLLQIRFGIEPEIYYYYIVTGKRAFFPEENRTKNLPNFSISKSRYFVRILF